MIRASSSVRSGQKRLASAISNQEQHHHTAEDRHHSGLRDRGGAANYGAQGVPLSTNYPGAIGYGAATWVDNAGNLWLYGGTGPGGILNDLWKYDIGTGIWTWMKGFGTPNQPGSFGTIAVGNTTNSGNRSRRGEIAVGDAEPKPQ